MKHPTLLALSVTLLTARGQHCGSVDFTFNGLSQVTFPHEMTLELQESAIGGRVWWANEEYSLSWREASEGCDVVSVSGCADVQPAAE